MVEASPIGCGGGDRAAVESISEQAPRALTAKERALIHRLQMLVRELDDFRAFEHARGHATRLDKKMPR